MTPKLMGNLESIANEAGADIGDVCQVYCQVMAEIVSEHPGQRADDAVDYAIATFRSGVGQHKLGELRKWLQLTEADRDNLEPGKWYLLWLEDKSRKYCEPGFVAGRYDTPHEPDGYQWQSFTLHTHHAAASGCEFAGSCGTGDATHIYGPIPEPVE